LPNLLGYLITPPYQIATFPWVEATGYPPAIVKAFHLPKTYNFEQTVGLLWSQPFLLLAIAGVAGPMWKKGQEPLKKWLALSALGAGLLGICGPLTVSGATMRYLLDCVPSLTVLAALGYWQMLEAAEARPRLGREIRAAARLAVAWQSMLGVLLGFTGYYGHFMNFNARLMHWLVSRLKLNPP
jgi:hypothetical protein